jgi:hypothetical protein
MKRPLLLALASALAGCGGEENALNEAEAARSIEQVATAAPVKKPDHRPTLAPLTAVDIRRELRPGPGCDFSIGERLLFVAVAGDALARVNGRFVHFTTAGPLGPTGGYFVGGGFTLSVGRTSDEGTAAGEAGSWPGRIAVSDHGRTERPVRDLRGSWRCGA